MKKLREFFKRRWVEILMAMLSVIVIISFINGVFFAEEKKPAYECWYDSLEMIWLKDELAAQAAKEEPPPVKTWKLPDYMRENLQRELDDFNKRFNDKVEAYKKELKTRFVEFKDMPEDVVLYLEGGIFITRSDYLKLQEQLRDKLKKEVKGDDKTTN